MTKSKILAPDELPSWVPKSDKQRRRWEVAGKLPKRLRISARKHGYVADEISAAEDRILAACLADRGVAEVAS